MLVWFVAQCLLCWFCCAVPLPPQAIPGLSPVPWWGTLFPLAVVLMVNGVKEAFDDYWRHKSDEQVCGAPPPVYSAASSQGRTVRAACCSHVLLKITNRMVLLASQQFERFLLSACFSRPCFQMRRSTTAG